MSCHLLLPEQLEEMEPEEYYTKVGHDGKGLRVPADLDQSICLYQQLERTNRAKFDRAAFWIDMARRQWNTSVSCILRGSGLGHRIADRAADAAIV